jgi:hypothetical protein
MRIGKLSAAAAVLSLCSLAAPVGGALADTTPTASAPAAAALPAVPLLSFVPPKVGALGVQIGATIIGGKVISPGVHVVMPGVSVPPMSSTPSSGTSTPSSGTSGR